MPEGTLLQLEVGMCLYGPFKFPDNLYPIAPILMLCPLSDIKLSKNLRVTLPHVIEDAREGDVEALGVQVIEADHKRLTDVGEFTFNSVIKDSSISFNTQKDDNLVTFSLSHFCFITLQAENKIEATERTVYCVCPLLPFIAGSSRIFHLCVTYFMRPYLKVSTNSLNCLNCT